MRIEAEQIRYRYPASERDALRGLSFSIPSGALCCLAGVNGSGKSTLLQMLAGVFEPGEGTLSFLSESQGQEAKPLSPRTALLPQDPDVYILGSLVQEDLLLALPPDDAEGRERALALARRFGLDKLLDEPVQILSHGQKRQLCLASALAGLPDILLLDEPFAGLDLPASIALREMMAENKAAGLTQIVSGHDLDLYADLVDLYLVLEKGELRAVGDGNSVFPLLLSYGVRPPCAWFAKQAKPFWL